MFVDVWSFRSITNAPPPKSTVVPCLTSASFSMSGALAILMLIVITVSKIRLFNFTKTQYTFDTYWPILRLFERTNQLFHIQYTMIRLLFYPLLKSSHSILTKSSLILIIYYLGYWTDGKWKIPIYLTVLDVKANETTLQLLLLANRNYLNR